MTDYDKISNGICPVCEERMEPTRHFCNNGFDKMCKKCRLYYHFVRLDVMTDYAEELRRQEDNKNANSKTHALGRQ